MYFTNELGNKIQAQVKDAVDKYWNKEDGAAELIQIWLQESEGESNSDQQAALIFPKIQIPVLINPQGKSSYASLKLAFTLKAQVSGSGDRIKLDKWNFTTLDGHQLKRLIVDLLQNSSNNETSINLN